MTSQRTQREARDVREAGLLEHAAHAILDQGGLPLAFDRLAGLAGVSKGLIYNYFPTQVDLGVGLLRREIEAIDRPAFKAACARPNIDEAARACAEFYFDMVAERGPLLHLLLADPILADGPARGECVRAALLLLPLIRRIRNTLGLTSREANVVLHLLLTYPEEAGRKVWRGEADRTLARRLCAEALAAGIAAIAGGPDQSAEALGAEPL